MQEIEKKRRAYHHEIKTKALKEYFWKIRNKKLKDLTQIEEE